MASASVIIMLVFPCECRLLSYIVGATCLSKDDLSVKHKGPFGPLNSIVTDHVPVQFGLPRFHQKII